MKTIGLARLGRDAELRFTPSGEAVCNLSLAVNYGKKGNDGNRLTQWIDASLWGKQAEALAPYLTKGSVHCFVLSDIHIETYQGQNGPGHKLSARVDSVELGPRVDQPQGQAQHQQQQLQRSFDNAYQQVRGGATPSQQRQAPPVYSDTQHNFDDTIPF
ncbi:MAG: single-stranded DNA-binding protein [Shewanella sp.]